MQKKTKALLGLGLGLILIGSVALAVFWPQWQFYTIQKAYQRSDFLQAKQGASAYLKAHPNHPHNEVLLAEILLREGQTPEAVSHLAHALQITQQGIHEGQNWKPLLEKIFYLRGLTHLVWALNITEDEYGHDYLTWALSDAQEDFYQAVLLTQDPHIQATTPLIKTVITADPDNSRQWWVLWQQFIDKDPLLKQLKKVEFKGEKPVKPTTQDPVRAAVQQWQHTKRQAFLQPYSAEPETILTGTALEETLNSLQWWKDHPEAEYHDIQLHQMRFLKITYPSEIRAEALVEVDETRHNSEEGKSRSRYRVSYTLAKVGEQWFIEKMDVQN